MTGAKEKKYFQVTNAANRETPTVDFGTPGAPAAGATTPAPAPAGTGATPAPARP
jgi:hypothetical protein